MHILGSKLGGKANCSLEGAGIGNAGPDDIERGAMGGCSEHCFQASGDCHAALEAFQFSRDLALVVVHCHHTIVIAGKNFQVDRVGRIWAAAVYPSGSNLPDGGLNEVDFLGPE